MDSRFQVIEYAGEGGRRADMYRSRLFSTLAEARADVASQLGLSRGGLRDRRWDGVDDDDYDDGVTVVEAYHSLPARSGIGCGGYDIYAIEDA